MRKTRRRKWKVCVGLRSLVLLATSYGNACRKAFRELIRQRHLKCQLLTDHETGGFVGVSAAPCE
jgi:hypothetical protein